MLWERVPCCKARRSKEYCWAAAEIVTTATATATATAGAPAVVSGAVTATVFQAWVGCGSGGACGEEPIGLEVHRSAG